MDREDEILALLRENNQMLRYLLYQLSPQGRMQDFTVEVIANVLGNQIDRFNNR